MIDLFRGWPSADLLPSDLILRASEKVFTDPSRYIPALLYGPNPGYEPLREAIATWLSQYYLSHWTSSERICISGGASQNFACILQVFTDPLYTRKVFMVTPTYYLACKIFEDNGFTGAFGGIPEDEEGIDISFFAKCLEAEERQNWGPRRRIKKPGRDAKLYRYVLYTVPTFSNPSGKCMSLRRRHELVRLARKYDVLIVADDVYDFLHWDSVDHSTSAVLPRLVDVDHQLDGGPTSGFGHVVSNGTFSKILGPGVRTGWAEATPAFVRGLANCGSTASGGAPSQLVAAFISEILAAGSLQEHIRSTVIPRLQGRCEAVTAAIQEFFPRSASNNSITLCQDKIETSVKGGYYLFVPLPPPLLATDVAAQALQQADLVVGGGRIFSVPGEKVGVSTYPESLRICFAWEQETTLYEGVRRLSRVIQETLANVDDSQTLDDAPGVVAYQNS